jgi:hypothetical protein
MKTSRPLAALALLLPLCLPFSAAEQKSLNPKVVKIVDEVSEDRIRAIIEKLVSFGTRNTMSNQDDPVHGVGAARQWIFDEFKSYSPRLQVLFDNFRVKKQGQRIFKDVDLWNVVAVLPGTKMPETQVLVTGHYDSLNLGPRPAAQNAGPGSEPVPVGERPQMTPEQFEKNASLPSPGACDDGSGTAAVMELARVMSQYEFDKTLVFIAFAGEEQGLVGSTLEAAKAKKENQVIEAVLNNDIIGTDRAGNGRTANGSVSVYSDESMDSLPQQLSRYAKEIGERYIPGFQVETVFMQDRLGRGGDHTPFQLEGFAAVRVSTPNEIYVNQHHDTDTLENMSVPYAAKVAKFNAAVAASLALAPKPPVVMRMPGAGRGQNAAAAGDGGRRGGTQPDETAAGGRAPAAGRGAAPGGRRPGPMISRGEGYDAVLQWRAAGSETDIQGYAVVMRATNAPYWEKEIYVGKVTQFKLKDVSIDDVKFGVKAIGNDGSESLVTAYVYPPRAKAEIETIDQ